MENSKCPHKNVKQEGGELVCKDCGLILEEKLASEYLNSYGGYNSDSQRDYEKRIRTGDSKALQDPIIREKYERIKTLVRERKIEDAQKLYFEQQSKLREGIIRL